MFEGDATVNGQIPQFPIVSRVGTQTAGSMVSLYDKPVFRPGLSTRTVLIIDIFIVGGLIVLVSVGVLGGGTISLGDNSFLACVNFANPTAYLSILGSLGIIWSTYLIGRLWDHDLIPYVNL